MIDEIFIIWNYLKENDVRYITIGGFAVNIYGYNRNTGDLDILIDDSIDNRRKLRKAFKDIGIGDFEAIETMQFIPGWTDFTLSFGLRLDVMTSIKGLEDTPFEELYDAATVVLLGGVEVKFIDYENLIKSKKACNRPKDQLDIEELNKLNEE